MTGEEVLVESISITHVLPCLADPAKIRVRAAPSADVSEVLPYLNAVTKNAIYNDAAHTLTFNDSGRIITLHPNLIVMAKVDDVDMAVRMLEEIRGNLNGLWMRRGEIEPLHQRRNRLGALDIYKLLPGLNCGQCGEATCLAFAVKLTGEDASVMVCAPLFTPDHRDKREALLELLDAAGYSVPSVFTGEG